MFLPIRQSASLDFLTGLNNMTRIARASPTYVFLLAMSQSTLFWSSTQPHIHDRILRSDLNRNPEKIANPGCLTVGDRLAQRQNTLGCLGLS